MPTTGGVALTVTTSSRSSVSSTGGTKPAPIPAGAGGGGGAVSEATLDLGGVIRHVAAPRWHMTSSTYPGSSVACGPPPCHSGVR